MKSLLRVFFVASLVCAATPSSYAKQVGGTNPHPMQVGGTNPHPIQSSWDGFVMVVTTMFGI